MSKSKYTFSELERLQALEASKFAVEGKTKEILESDENNREAIGGDILKNGLNKQVSVGTESDVEFVK